MDSSYSGVRSSFAKASTIPYHHYFALLSAPAYFRDHCALYNLQKSRSCESKMSFQTRATIASFGGKLLKLSHNASSTNCEMGLNLYLPPQATKDSTHKVPVLIFLSGLTATGDNCAEKGFFQHGASQKGIAVVYPDTSPSKYSLLRNGYGAGTDDVRGVED